MKVSNSRDSEVKLIETYSFETMMANSITIVIFSTHPSSSSPLPHLLLSLPPPLPIDPRVDLLPVSLRSPFVRSRDEAPAFIYAFYCQLPLQPPREQRMTQTKKDERRATKEFDLWLLYRFLFFFR